MRRLTRFGNCSRLRVTIPSPSGSVPGRDMYFDAGVADTDAVVDAGAFKVVIDQESVERLNGATVDFRDEGSAGSGFAIDNPNETGHSCTCGKRG